MSTRESVEWGNEAQATPEWHVDPKPWCPSCCVPLLSCGCPIAEAELDRLRLLHVEGMGTE